MTNREFLNRITIESVNEDLITISQKIDVSKSLIHFNCVGVDCSDCPFWHIVRDEHGIIIDHDCYNLEENFDTWLNSECKFCKTCDE